MSIYINEFEKMYSSSVNLLGLRTRVLNLAVQGKLLGDKGSSGSAMTLLDEISKEKEMLIKTKKDKKFKPSTKFEYDYLDMELPNGWVWRPLGEITTLIMGQSPKGESISENETSGIEFHQGKSYFGIDYLQPSGKYASQPKKIAPANSILISVRAPVGTVNYSDREVCIGRGLSAIVPLANTVREYLFIAIRAYEGWLNEYATGSTFKAISGEVLGNLMIPVPSVEDQVNTSEQVGNLMSQIDQLEEKLKKKERLMELLPQAVVDAIGSCQTGGELKTQLEFIIENFEETFQTPESMQDLRNVILQLAIEGKLVEQDENDEPASVLVERIKDVREQLVKDKKIKKHNKLEPITEEEIPFEIPENWEWVKMGEIGSSFIGLTYKPSNVVTDGLPVLRSNNIKDGKINHHELVYVNSEPKEDLFVRYDDLLICARNGSKRLVGKTALIDESSVGMTFGAFMTIYRSQFNRFIYQFLNSKFFRNQLDDSNTTTVYQVTQSILLNAVMPLPPVEEQKRIVSRIESLMVIIDEMEEKLKRKQRVVEKLGTA